jgi:omega-6 fatty acid desaturase (delta-12 desaturase)
MEKNRLNKIIRPFAKSIRGLAIWQIVNTVLPYFGLIYLMYYMLSRGVHFLLVLPLSIVPAFLLVRIFIFFHDCTHSSFLKSRKWMSFWGHFFGVLTFTPYNKWKREHITHHRTVGNIDKRGVGDVWTMTVQEFEQSSWLKRLGYKLYRNPLIMFVIGPFYLFVIHERLPLGLRDKKEWFSVMFTNIMIAGIITVVSLTIGFKYYLMIQVPIIFFASIFGVWMFFVQHQYEDVYWEHTENWDIITASMKGSSVYRLPWILDWATGYIGYHNLHHINARIPNYRLKRAFHSDKFFQTGVVIRFWESFKLMTLKLYEEKSKRLIGYKEYRKLRKKIVVQ